MTTPEKFFLVKYSDNWSDEMDVEGFRVFTEIEKNEYFKAFEKIFKYNIKEYGSFEYGVGTNQQIEYKHFKNFERAFSVKEISKNEYIVLDDLDLSEFGFFPDAFDFEDGEDEEE